MRRNVVVAAAALAVIAATSVTSAAAQAPGNRSAAADAAARPSAGTTTADVVPQSPTLTVLKRSDSDAPGDLFIAPKSFGSSFAEIVTDRGRPVWVDAIPNGDQATDFRVQSYGGHPVLTWWQGKGLGGQSQGVDYVMDSSYHVVATIRGGGGFDPDGHEFRLTQDGTALLTCYHLVPYDLSALGGAKDARVIEGVIEDVDVATGQVRWRWRSLDYVPPSDSYLPVDLTYDYFHINSINFDTDGDLLVSARGTSTVYKLDRDTGKIIWRLGGKRSDFALGSGARFTGQHDAAAAGPNMIRLFDNGTDGANQQEPRSRVIWIQLNQAAHTAELAKQITHPNPILAQSQGNAQPLDNGDTLVGWGSTGHFSEFDPNGNLLFDAQLLGHDNYRAYRYSWNGEPDTPPTAAASRGPRTTTIHAIWNGATQVAQWQIRAGRTKNKLALVRTIPWNGLDTQVKLRSRNTMRYVQVTGLDRAGTTLSSSTITRVK
jgi:Arylsulfotransferase (ASST)